MAGQGTDHPLERLVFFSDAVFAIAITLLVIEIHVPHIAPETGDAAFWQALAGLIPNFVGFAISFGVIGAFWVGHHRAFSLTGRFGRQLVFPNMLLLGAIAFMPFVTAFASAHQGRTVPAVVYWAWLLLTALLSLRLNGIATRPPLLSEQAEAGAGEAVRRRSLGVVLGAATALAVALIAPLFAPAGMATIPLWQGLLARLQRPVAPAGPEA
jgi:uncharacterized membrane protein